MDDYRYTYAVARISVLSTRLIDKAFASRVLAAEPREILRMLSETDYAQSFASIEDPADFDRGLIIELGKTYDLLHHICPEKEVIELLRKRYDFHNLKALLKAHLLEVPANGSIIDLGTYALEKLSATVSENAYRFVPDYIRDTALQAVAAYEKTQKLEEISRICDRAMWMHLIERAREVGNEIVIDLFRKHIDFVNIKTFIRIKEFAEDRDVLNASFIPGGSYTIDFFLHSLDEQISMFLTHLDRGSEDRRVLSEGLSRWPEDRSFWRLELAIDNYFLNRFYQMRNALFSIAPLIYYLLRKESDGKFLRTVIKSKMIGMARNEIEERVRFLYV
ncbi:MAG: hypothetical protein C4520_04675 [Candidatus Abyssobacteria bacterium SURF_5]|uniref:V-type ATP synthase subunit C n=1 Tax=Abyssobacteria bacterium (strain SURF_5) TaxID=2093360 RepID=A0A3A4NUG3_ABYX5|nr:MAG: hypothetical protein C4520_04675 [Candidatus Abyssubacteria bacterium SURF_5]